MACELLRQPLLDAGDIVADGAPDALLAAPGSPLRAMLDAERALRAELDAGRGWRRLRVSQGTLHEAPHTPTGRTLPADTANAGTPDEHPVCGDPAPEPAPACAHRAAPAFVVFAGATILRYTAFAASWSVIGSAVLSDTDAGLGTWALLLSGPGRYAASALFSSSSRPR